jgi:hypothetical protein
MTGGEVRRRGFSHANHDDSERVGTTAATVAASTGPDERLLTKTISAVVGDWSARTV